MPSPGPVLPFSNPRNGPHAVSDRMMCFFLRNSCQQTTPRVGSRVAGSRKHRLWLIRGWFFDANPRNGLGGKGEEKTFYSRPSSSTCSVPSNVYRRFPRVFFSNLPFVFLLLAIRRMIFILGRVVLWCGQFFRAEFVMEALTYTQKPPFAQTKKTTHTRSRTRTHTDGKRVFGVRQRVQLQE